MNTEEYTKTLNQVTKDITIMVLDTLIEGSAEAMVLPNTQDIGKTLAEKHINAIRHKAVGICMDTNKEFLAKFVAQKIEHEIKNIVLKTITKCMLANKNPVEALTQIKEKVNALK